MARYITTDACLMAFLRSELDDPAPACGRCANCAGNPLDPTVEPLLSSEAHNFIKLEPIVIEPRKQAPSALRGLNLREHRLEEGHALTRYSDPGWGELVQRGRYETSRFDDHLIEASARLIRRWSPHPAPTWLTAVPNRISGGVVINFAQRLADTLEIEFVEAVIRVADNPPQNEMQNSYQQARNVLTAIAVRDVRSGPVLLVDDIVDSRWTLTVVGNLLLQEGAGAVHPFALADAGRG